MSSCGSFRKKAEKAKKHLRKQRGLHRFIRLNWVSAGCISSLCVPERNSPCMYIPLAPHIPGWDNPGSFHSVDLWFFFETLAKCWRPFTGIHYDLARLMCNYWTEFIKKGNPDGRDADGTQMPVLGCFRGRGAHGDDLPWRSERRKRPEDEWMTFMKKHVKG